MINIAERHHDITYWVKIITRQTEERDILARSYPMLVTFDDIADPASVREVDPADLAATFGEGYALTRMTLQVTDEPATEGVVEGVLGWVWTHAGYLNGTKRLHQSRPELNLTIIDFMKGAKNDT